MYNLAIDVQNCTVPNDSLINFTEGNKFFELTNHLGNVLATVSDKRMEVDSSTDTTLISYYTANVVTASDYYPFGMEMPGRTYSLDTGARFRYGFNNKEKSDEIEGAPGVDYDYGARIYDARLGRFLGIDPIEKEYPYYTPYQFAGNTPIVAIDIDGLEEYIVNRSVDAYGHLTKILIQSFTDVNGKLRDNELWNHPNTVLKRRNVYIITRGPNGQVGRIKYSNALTPEQQTIVNNFTNSKQVTDYTKGAKGASYGISDIANEGPLDGKGWTDGYENIAELKTVTNIPIQFNGNSDVAKLNEDLKLAPVSKILKLFPTSKVTLTGNTGSDPGNPFNLTLGSSSTVLNSKTTLDNNPNATTGQLMLGRANTAKNILNTKYGISNNRITTQTGTQSGTPAGRNVGVQVTNLNL